MFSTVVTDVCHWSNCLHFNLKWSITHIWGYLSASSLKVNAFYSIVVLVTRLRLILSEGDYIIELRYSVSNKTEANPL